MVLISFWAPRQRTVRSPTLCLHARCHWIRLTRIYSVRSIILPRTPQQHYRGAAICTGMKQQLPHTFSTGLPWQAAQEKKENHNYRRYVTEAAVLRQRFDAQKCYAASTRIPNLAPGSCPFSSPHAKVFDVRPSSPESVCQRAAEHACNHLRSPTRTNAHVPCMTFKATPDRHLVNLEINLELCKRTRTGNLPHDEVCKTL